MEIHRPAHYACFAVLFLAPPLSAQGLDYVKAHYIKTEHQIQMRDGERLFTAVYVPKDTSRKYPILMTRRQSGVEPYGTNQYHKNLGPSPLFGKEGYIFVYQDIRGRWMSEGTFVNMRPHNPAKGPKDVDESSDTYDTIDWLLKNVVNHNGKVGHYGMSYRGWLVAAGMIDAHPARHFKGKNQLWNDLMKHPTYDEFWKARNLRPHLKNIKPALLTVGGWFDAENLFGVLEANRRLEADGATNVFVMGPWIHGGWNFTSGAALGPVTFGSNTADFFRENVELPFFNYHLKGKGDGKLPKALIFETGANRWREFTRWPPTGTKPLELVFQANGPNQAVGTKMLPFIQRGHSESLRK